MQPSGTTGKKFSWLQTASDASARTGRLETPHGSAETPLFMPVGTKATVKGLAPDRLREAGIQVVLANAYHLMLRPGEKIVEAMGGLQSFMAWNGPVLTDSGGYQIFSLARLTRVDDEAAVFRSHIDGERIVLTPERAIEVQEALGADIIMQLDHCVAYPCEKSKVAEALKRTTLWARRSASAKCRDEQALFGIVQGGVHTDLRRQSAQELAEMDFPGYAVGGLCVGEEPGQRVEALEAALECMPTDRPRYLMGIGEPRDIFAAVARGVDMFDCVLPTRNGRNASAFTPEGPIRLRGRRFKTDSGPLGADCDCFVCGRFTRAYIRHLFNAGEMLGPMLVSLHNVRFFARLFSEVREAIGGGNFAAFSKAFLDRYGGGV
ncbi:MAG: tRNA guanosine(34) transglycosylase Tgt [Phycisphaerae bacterium]|nr:tRNA guanosine(34) transglycosylase Tgt [Phycisphaerae bacterium]